MSKVGAYIDLPKWETLPEPESAYIAEGDILARSDAGLDVAWLGGEPPERAQVYIEWTPWVYAVWEEEEIKDEHGTEVEQPGQGDSEEADGGTGQGGEGAGEGPGSGPEEPNSAE